MSGNPMIANLQRELERVGEKDKGLWQYRIAAAAMRKGEYALARQNLDEMLGLIEANYGNPNVAAAKVRGLFTQEAGKPFIGEPHERVMACYYRAILYWMDGEPDNARALFRTAALHDADAADTAHASDYILLDYLDGYITAKRGRRKPGAGADALARARASAAAQERPIPPDYDTKANVFLFAEFNRAPYKSTEGKADQKLIYKYHADDDRLATNASVSIRPVSTASTRLNARDPAQYIDIAVPIYDDIGFQAITRGERLMDQILENKATVRKTTENIAKLLSFTIPYAVYIFKLTEQMGTGADTRCWDNLPRYLGFVAFKRPPGDYEARLYYKGDYRSRDSSESLAFTVPDAGQPPRRRRSKDIVLFRSELSKGEFQGSGAWAYWRF
jgi:hypothetical protein